MLWLFGAVLFAVGFFSSPTDTGWMIVGALLFILAAVRDVSSSVDEIKKKGL